MPKKALLIDFDGVLHDYAGWKGPEVVGPPIPKARAAMFLLEKTHRLICFTTRPKDIAEAWLRRHGFPAMKVTNIKEPAHLIIDDRALTFRGQWDDSFLKEISSFSPHWATDSPAPPSPDSST